MVSAASVLISAHSTHSTGGGDGVVRGQRSEGGVSNAVRRQYTVKLLQSSVHLLSDLPHDGSGGGRQHVIVTRATAVRGEGGVGGLTGGRGGGEGLGSHRLDYGSSSWRWWWKYMCGSVRR